ncbi:4Fe-4S dicluster domain-containing protein [Peptoniphilaceae bacterium SGI.131]
MAKGRVEFNEDYCKGCGLCVSVCPTQTLSLSKDRLNAKGYTPAYAEFPEKCIGCTNCAIMCPDSVITVYRLVETKEA